MSEILISIATGETYDSGGEDMKDHEEEVRRRSEIGLHPGEVASAHNERLKGIREADAYLDKVVAHHKAYIDEMSAKFKARDAKNEQNRLDEFRRLNRRRRK